MAEEKQTDIFKSQSHLDDIQALRYVLENVRGIMPSSMSPAEIPDPIE